ncbi:MAG: hypothetical protein ACPL3Q_10005 [Candidatus Ratteibacteria bacterium]
MKKMIMVLGCMLFLASFGTFLLAAETPAGKVKPPVTSATPATPATPAKPAAEKKVNIQKITGEITSIDTTANTITIKKEDGTEVTLKATTPKIQEEIKKLSTGKKVTALYKETKTGECVLIKVSEYKEKPSAKGKEKGKNK